MLRITELKLPLDHTPKALEAAIVERLGTTPADLVRYTIARRGNDARRKSAIKLVYAIDVTLADEAAVLARLAGDPHVAPRPIPRTASSHQRPRLPTPPAPWSSAPAPAGCWRP